MLIPSLRQRLKEPLPGVDAQLQMISHQLAVTPKRFAVPDNHKTAAVMVLVYEKNRTWHTALMQRPESPYPHSRQVSFPGGGLEAEDSNIQEAALRETEEEFGISRQKIEVIGSLTQLYIPVSNYLVFPFVGYLPEVPQFVPDFDEVEEIIEVPIVQLLDKGNRKRKTISTHSGSLPNVPYFELNHKIVWGATAMMLSEFVTVLEDLTTLILPPNQ